jgi:hypothetical protein
MAKFGTKTEDDVVAKVDIIPSAPVTPTPSVATPQQSSGGSLTASEIESNIEKQSEHWVKAYWRPAMGWLYMAMCAFDFIIFPIFAMMQPVFMKIWKIEMQYTAWKSLTLDNGGLIHLAFGAILGVAAWSRGQEKISKV